jgi:hypothetical protein
MTLTPLSPQARAAVTMEEQFRAAADLLERFLVDGAFRSDKPADFAITHLVGRSLADLRWGQYLACEGYPIQMYSVIRPVSEALNLIDLFVKEPERAEAWAAGEYRQFQPAAVRKELGIDSDPVYAWMAEHSHPRFAGLQLTTYKIKREGEEWQNVLFLGELPLEFGPVLIATTMPGLALLDLALAAGHVVVRKEVALGWATMLRQVAELLEVGFQAVWDAADFEDVGLDELGAKMREAIKSAADRAREIEQIADEAKAKADGPRGDGAADR